MLTLPIVCTSKPPSGFSFPKPNKKLTAVQKKRRGQLKQVINDVADIANKEIDRFRELTNELLSDPKDNPIVPEIVTESSEVSRPESQE